jgi:hypothetical protein
VQIKIVIVRILCEAEKHSFFVGIEMFARYVKVMCNFFDISDVMFGNVHDQLWFLNANLEEV